MATDEGDDFDEPPLKDEFDPVYQHELYYIWRHLGMTPDDLTEDTHKQTYTEWLAKHS